MGRGAWGLGDLGGRVTWVATWVVVQPGWSCNLGGRATWVVNLVVVVARWWWWLQPHAQAQAQPPWAFKHLNLKSEM